MSSARFPWKDGVPSHGVLHVVYGIPPAVPFVRGDANFDDRVDLSDVIFNIS